MLISAGLGLIVGIILALTGAGGGILAVPLLVFGVGLRVAEAGPIGLLAVGMAAALGAGLGLKAGTVRYKAALLMAGTGMLISPFGIWLADRVANRWLSILFALVLLLVAYRAFRQAHNEPMVDERPRERTPPCILDTESGRFVWTARCARTLALSGTVAGFLSGLLGVGGGFVLVPVLQRYTDLAMQLEDCGSLLCGVASGNDRRTSDLLATGGAATAIRFCGCFCAGRRRNDWQVNPLAAKIMRTDFCGNRDAAHFPEPERFDIDRDNAKTHLSFGFS